MITKPNYIKALGHLLASIETELAFMSAFQDFKAAKRTFDQYLDQGPDSFSVCLNYFRVSRNVGINHKAALLHLTHDWVSSPNSNDVDAFANRLKLEGITHNKIMTSLASKVLLLNNPWVILPIDTQARNAIGGCLNNYSLFSQKIESFRTENNMQIKTWLQSVDAHLRSLSNPFKSKLGKLELICENRYVDKLLWTSGK